MGEGPRLLIIPLSLESFLITNVEHAHCKPLKDTYMLRRNLLPLSHQGSFLSVVGVMTSRIFLSLYNMALGWMECGGRGISGDQVGGRVRIGHWSPGAADLRCCRPGVGQRNKAGHELTPGVSLYP